jgi:hypothetical protein
VKDTIYLRVTRNAVTGMTKSPPKLNRGEIFVKVVVDVEPSAFREPVIERRIHVADWREGVDLGDIDLKVATITEEEAQIIRQRRLALMRKILEEHGHVVTANEPAEGEGGGDG